ncbi:MAG TPA: beta-eliminating lyase-related protein [Actinophytocola sp.]|uniref:threonine aldolase family protein n=1 Tax=Actinophytocola sp. TaxID=1872138 RepID=UPI002DBFD435|nr:beta-eliminating lyase-related protein [Actinophytocola sp.]HEU5470335.1 beta-eliminating lyase-related protein [Actinophytocola sp.]
MSNEPPTRSVSVTTAPSRRPARMLPAMIERVGPDDLEYDPVPRFERRMAELLGKPAAVMFPSGTMAQQVALRIHADRRGIRSVAFHPRCHLEVHEHKGYAAVHGLVAALVGDGFSLITLADLAELREPIAALLLELPQRDIGGQLPGWEDLVAQTGWARERGAAVHLDGARLWEAQPFYDRPHAEIAALFDTVYVSLYKGLMGISGAMLAGEQDVIDHARVWRDRLGGNVDRCWPLVLPAERGLAELMPRMAEFADRARSLAAALAALPGVHVVPDPPQTPMFHLHLDAGQRAVTVAVQRLRAETGLALPRYVWPTDSPDRCGLEITVSEQLDEVDDAEVADLVAELIRRTRDQSSSDSSSISPSIA